ncbi:MAG TPA: hypothetical protein PLV58_05925 [Campylobacterales bacterium]|nr:hypothetical protein [Campylobacterales bacterium]
MKKSLFILLFSVSLTPRLFADVVVIAHQNVPKMDVKTVGKVFTGKVTTVSGSVISAVNQKNQNVKNKFLQNFVGLDEEKYIAYWTVRKYIGKGVPPKELSSSEEVIRYVQATPGAIGYIDDSDLKNGLNIVAR